MPRLNVDINDEDYAKLRQEAAAKGVSISDMIREDVSKRVNSKKRATLAISPQLDPEALKLLKGMADLSKEIAGNK